MLRPYYTMHWICVLVTGTENAIEKEPNASHIGYITLAFARILLAFCSRWVKTRDKVQNASETTHIERKKRKKNARKKQNASSTQENVSILHNAWGKNVCVGTKTVAFCL